MAFLLPISKDVYISPSGVRDAANSRIGYFKNAFYVKIVVIDITIIKCLIIV